MKTRIQSPRTKDDRAERKGAQRAPQQALARRGRRLAMPESVGEIISELRKVTWPTRDQTLHLTILVIMVSVGAGLILGFIDWIFTQLVHTFLLS